MPDYPPAYIPYIRQKIGRSPIFLAYATVIATDANGRFLLQHRADFNRWGLPGGALELNEDIAACARRELAEETGLTVGDLRLVGVYTHPDYDVVYPNGDQAQQFSVCFAAPINGGTPRVDGTENNRQAFFTTADLPGLDLLPWYRVMLADAYPPRPPIFDPPVSNGRLRDQIAAVRPHIGHDWYIGVGATALIIQNGRLLMAQWPDADFWVFPGGYAHLGETISHTIIREVREETGLTITPQRIVGVYSAPRYHHIYPNGDKVKGAGVLFRARPTGGTLAPATAEIARLDWVLPTEAPSRVSPAWRPLAQQALAHLHSGAFID